MLIDIHTHILPGVDDGARDMNSARDMLRAAKMAGINVIVLTPHVYSYDVDLNVMYQKGGVDHLKEYAKSEGIRLLCGCELNYRAIVKEGHVSLDRFCVEGTNAILLELSNSSLFPHWVSVICDMCEKYNVVIVHPERCRFFQKNLSAMCDMREYGCEFQVDAELFSNSLFSQKRKTLSSMLSMNLINYVASDAHTADDYKLSEKLIKQNKWRQSGMLAKSIAEMIT